MGPQASRLFTNLKQLQLKLLQESAQKDVATAHCVQIICVAIVAESHVSLPIPLILFTVLLKQALLLPQTAPHTH